jgi:hypothetical protein
MPIDHDPLAVQAKQMPVFSRTPRSAQLIHHPFDFLKSDIMWPRDYFSDLALNL